MRRAASKPHKITQKCRVGNAFMMKNDGFTPLIKLFPSKLTLLLFSAVTLHIAVIHEWLMCITAICNVRRCKTKYIFFV